MGEPIATKTANALIPDAEPSFDAKYVLGSRQRIAAGGVIQLFKKLMGGLWVGGRVNLFPDRLVFRPNALNQKVHEEDHTVVVPLADVREVRVRSGFGTRIIDVTTAHGVFSLRCFGAEAFADEIRKRAGGTKKGVKGDPPP